MTLTDDEIEDMFDNAFNDYMNPYTTFDIRDVHHAREGFLRGFRKAQELYEKRPEPQSERREFIKQASIANSAALLSAWHIKDLVGSKWADEMDLINEIALKVAGRLAEEVLNEKAK